jgi:hypothetical protein
MDETTPLIPTSSKNQSQHSTGHHEPGITESGSKSTAVLSQSFYFSTQPVQLPVADEDDEEEQVDFLQSDDDAEDSEDDNVMENSDHHVTFAFEDDEDEDDDEDDVSYEEDSEGDATPLEENHLKESSSREITLPQDQRYPIACPLGVEQPSDTPSKPKQRKVNQRIRKKSRPLTSSYNNNHTTSSNNATPNFRRARAHSFDTTNTGFTQNTVLSEAIASVISHAKDAIVESISEVTHVVSDVMHEEIKPVTPRPEGQHQQKLSAIALAVLVFYKVSGGPFGCEPAVRSAGNFWALLGFIVFPFVWALQEALVTAELGSAFPEPSGCKILFLQTHNLML